ncbi:MAG: DNA repair protein RecN [Candidatus Omnitrophica bacterium]|nr:DNA repair protein RecN [Candidatus Omnitrophota bacterium]
MLTHLTIHNFGLIDRLSLDLCPSLNILTGETGAGKSILIGALSYCLGSQIKRSQVRDPDRPSVVEAVFELTENFIAEYPDLSEFVTDEDRELIISRRYSPDGKNRDKINGLTVTLTQLREIGNRLVDLHGPHDHQMLFSEDSHIEILDSLGEIGELKKEYSSEYAEYSSLEKELSRLSRLAESRDRELDILSHQIKELEQVSLETSDYEQMQNDMNRVNNAEKLYECVSSMVELLDGEENGACRAIERSFPFMRTLNRTDSDTAELHALLENMQENASELSSALASYLRDLSFSPGEADRINRLYDTYYDLLRKYGPGLEDVRGFYAEAVKKHETLLDLEHSDAEIRTKLRTARKAAVSSAASLTGARKKAAKLLKATIEKELKELGIANVKFECKLEAAGLSENGSDRVTFFISPNAGEDLKPLADIVSSGEAARVMLALKKALTKVDPVPVLVFDEIDSQIGGRLGQVTGKKLKELSNDRQVILITHLPQIASFGDRHYRVSKQVKGDRTSTVAELLEGDERIQELAKMMSGDKETGIAVEHARDMLQKASG